MKFIKSIYRFYKYVYIKLKYNLIYLCQKNRKLSDIVTNTEESILFFTHNFGGGTEIYEKNYIVAQKNILIVRMISYKKDLVCKIENPQTKYKFYIKFKDLYTIFQHKYKRIIINSLVCVYDCINMLTLLHDYKKKNNSVELVYNIHDFHCICPRVNLIAKDRYCNLECSKYNCRFTLFPDAFSDTISRWRTAWNLFLISVDQITCFSESSKKLLLQAYKYLPEYKIKIIPHDMSYCHFTPILFEQNTPMNIGIVGSCFTVPKGKYIVTDILKIFSLKYPDIKITLLGSKKKYFKINGKNISYLGPYKHTDLQKLIEKNKISVILFPSIWPETFSYLISELMQMQIPIVCFDYGAQAEKVRTYTKGVICKNSSFISIYEALTKANLL